MARPIAKDHREKRSAILKQAAVYFADHGYDRASVNGVAGACGISKSLIYHYYDSKQAILFDLLDRYTLRLLGLIGETEAVAQRRNLDERAALHELVRRFVQEYETSATRHVALVNQTQFLSDDQRALIVGRQRDVVAAFTRFIKRAYPERINARNQTALTMMLFGMINWTFTWLRPQGPLSYDAFAQEVIDTLENGFHSSAS